MKLMLAFCFTFLVLTTIQAQFPIDKESGLVVYTDVLEMPNMTKDQIHEKAKFWIISTLKSGDNMVELNGSNSDKIVGTGNLVLDKFDAGTGKVGSVYYPTAVLNFKFIVFIKENKLKYKLENFDLMFGSGGYSKVHSNLVNLRTSLEGNTIYGNNAKSRENLELRNTPYIDAILKSLIQDFTKSMQTENEEDW